MIRFGTRRAFLAGLIGGLLGALLVAGVPVVSAAVGDALRLGEVNTANAVTTVRGSSDATLRLQNQQAGAPALDLRVTGAGPPLRVDSARKVARLNADRVDGRSANQITRVAYAEAVSPPGGDGALVTATITAPTDGYLVMSGSVGLHGLAYDNVMCSLAVRREGTTKFYGHREQVVEDAGGEHTSNAYEVCATDAVAPVSKGTYEVSLWIFYWQSAGFGRASVWSIFVPYDGTGAAAHLDSW